MNRYFGIALTLGFLGFLVYYFSDLVTWLIVAWVISLLGSPIMSLLGRLRVGGIGLSSTVRAVLVLGSFYALFGFFIYFFTPPLLKQTRNLAGVDYTSILNSLDEPISHASDWLIEHQLMQGEFSEYYVPAPTEANDSMPSRDSTALNPEALDSLMHQREDKSNTIEPSTDSSFQVEPLDSNALLDSLPQARDSLARDSGQRASSDSLQKGEASPTPAIALDTTSKQGFLKASIDLEQLNAGDSAKGLVNIWIELPKDQKQQEEEDKAEELVIHKDSRSAFEALKARVLSYFDISSLLTGAAAYLLSILSNLIIFLTSVSFIAFFFLKDEGLFGRGIKAATPEKYTLQIDTALQKIKIMLSRYFAGIFLQMTVITVYLWTVLSFFGVQNALLIAFFAALINIIPYIGPLLGALFGIIITLGSNVDADFYAYTLPILLQVAGVFLSMQLLDNFLLQPLIFSKSVLAHPLEIFIIVIVGAKLGSIIGMIVAIPFYTIFRVIAFVFLNEFHLVKNLTQHFAKNIKVDMPNANPPSED